MPATGDPEKEKVRVLVIDDDHLTRWAAVRHLQDATFAVTEAGSAEEAISFMAGQPFDLIVSDIVLPGADGVAVLTAAQVAQPRAAVLLMTAHEEVLSKEEALRLGAARLIIKRPDMHWIEEIMAAALSLGPRARGSASREV
jgi:two-component system response regulator AtoC